MDETFITLSINKFLSENNYEVIQCIPPGGQGGIYFSLKNNIIYPDIICLKKNPFVFNKILETENLFMCFFIFLSICFILRFKIILRDLSWKVKIAK